MKVSQEGNTCYYDDAESGDRLVMIAMLGGGFISDKSEMPDRSDCLQSGNLEPTGDLADIGGLSDYCITQEAGAEMIIAAGANFWGVSVLGNTARTNAEEVLDLALKVAGVVSHRATERSEAL